jgi:hypothetical protein
VRSRIWYFLLLVFPALFGNSNVRQRGDFLPGAATGLLLAVAIIGAVEAVRFAVQLFRRRRV